MKRSETSIKTDRLWLRQIDATDAESIVKLRSDESVYKYFLNPVRLSIDEHKKWYREIYNTSDERIDWIAVDDETGEFIGIYGAKKDVDGSIEISYLTVNEKKHQGYASEAIRAIIKWCRGKLEEATFMVQIHKNNASIQFAKKIGFHYYKKLGHFLKLKLEDSGSVPYK